LEKNVVEALHESNESLNGSVLKQFNDSIFVIQNFSNEKNPDQTEILIYNWGEENPKFHLSNTRILAIEQTWMEIPHPHFVNKTIRIDLMTGQEYVANSNETTHVTNTDITYTQTYTEESEYFNWFITYFKKKGISPIMQIEHLNTSQRTFIAYYQQENNMLSHHLSILDSSGEIIKTILLEDNLTGIGKDTFFVLKNKAIFASDNHILNIYDF
jgi:hypothetical protein